MSTRHLFSVIAVSFNLAGRKMNISLFGLPNNVSILVDDLVTSHKNPCVNNDKVFLLFIPRYNYGIQLLFVPFGQIHSINNSRQITM